MENTINFSNSILVAFSRKLATLWMRAHSWVHFTLSSQFMVTWCQCSSSSQSAVTSSSSSFSQGFLEKHFLERFGVWWLLLFCLECIFAYFDYALIIQFFYYRPKMASPTNTLLMGIAICDLLTIIFPAPLFIYTYTLNR